MKKALLCLSALFIAAPMTPPQTYAASFAPTTITESAKPPTIEYKRIERRYIGYNIYDLTQPSNLTEAEISAYFERFPALQPFAGIIAEADSDVNAVFLIAVIRLESGNGENLTTANNYGNIIDFYTGEYISYGTAEQGITALICLLKREYLTESGMWYSGLSVRDVERHYCNEGEWAETVIKIMGEIDESVRKI